VPKDSRFGRRFFLDDFAGFILDARIWGLATSTGTCLTNNNNSGGVTLLTAAAIGSYVHLYGNRGYTAAMSAEVEFQFFNSETANVLMEVGLRDGRTGTSYVHAQLDTNVSSTWQARCSAAGSGPTTASMGVVLDAWTWRFIRIKTSGANALFFYNGALVATLAADIPTVDLEPYVYLYSRAAVVKNIYLNYVWAQGDRA
jgi:hypothetical protein